MECSPGAKHLHSVAGMGWAALWRALFTLGITQRRYREVITTSASLRVFMAYQFRNSQLARIDREYAMSQAISNVNEFLADNNLPGSATWEALDLESWRSVGSQVLNVINTSTIFMADISELNPNVLLELGVALGIKERSRTFEVHLLAHESLDLRSLPSDMLGGYVARYKEENFQAIVARLLRD